MAVPEQIPVVNYVADGIVKKFDVPFEYDQQSDLHIYVDGAEPTIDKYFFADNAFNFYIAPTSGQGVKIKRITPKERDTDYNLHTNTVRPKALNTDFDRLWYVLQEVFSDVGGLSQQVQEEIIARIQGDEELLNQLTAEISARMLGDEAVTEDLKNYVDQVIGAIINDPDFDGIDADKVNDASGETQQQVNYNGGSKWHSRVGGYKLNERVVLNNGDIVKSLLANNINDPEASNLAGWVNLTKTGDLIDTRLYGLRVNTLEDQTAAIHAAFAANPKANNFYIPSGTIKANVVYPREYLNLVGDSMLTTIIEPFDLTKAAVSFGKKLYPAIHKLSLNAGQDFTGVNLLDATDSRYMILEEFDIKKTIKAGETHKYETVLIDQRPVVTTWTGYNTLNTVRATYGAYGYLSDVEKLNSVLSMKSCVFAANGYFGIKTNIENGSMLSMDVAGNGVLCPVGTYDESMYGGMYLSGENSVIVGSWHEYNQPATINFSENNIYFHPAKANNIVHNFGRNTRGSNGARVFSRSQGQLINVSVADRATDDGLGRARNQQLCKNGNFIHINSTTTRPKAWGGSLNGTWAQETVDLPNGYNTGFKFTSNAAGISNLVQTIYDSANLANSYIKDLSKWVGREVTVSFWLKNNGTSTSALRGGIAIDASSYFSDGNYFSSTVVGAWQKFIVSRKITGTETKIAFGLRATGVGEGFITAGWSFSDDCRVLDSQSKPITEDGGEIYGSLEVNGLISQNGDPLVGRPFQTGTNGLQSAATPINTTGKYIGKFAWNATDSKLYYATGATATSAWKSTDGATTITPV